MAVSTLRMCASSMEMLRSAMSTLLSRTTNKSGAIGRYFPILISSDKEIKQSITQQATNLRSLLGFNY